MTYNYNAGRKGKENEKLILLKLFISSHSEFGQNIDLVSTLQCIGRRIQKNNFVEVIRTGTNQHVDKLQRFYILKNYHQYNQPFKFYEGNRNWMSSSRVLWKT